MKKKVVILRGPSGSGKSTLVLDEFLKGDGITVVCSADNYFLRRGGAVALGGPLEVYEFDPTKLPEAHSWCMEQFLTAIMGDVETIVVDNTNIRKWEYRNYELVARMAGYDVVVFEVVPKTVEEIRLCASRNVHKVPLSVVASMAVNFEHDDKGFIIPIKEG